MEVFLDFLSCVLQWLGELLLQLLFEVGYAKDRRHSKNGVA
jgi:hypothetical protein